MKRGDMFIRLMDKFLSGIALPINENEVKWGYPYLVDTKAGKMRVSVPSGGQGKHCYTVFCRFDDVDLANQTEGLAGTTRLNRYTGKWNFHITAGDESEESLARQIQREMSKIVLKTR